MLKRALEHAESPFRHLSPRNPALLHATRADRVSGTDEETLNVRGASPEARMAGGGGADGGPGQEAAVDDRRVPPDGRGGDLPRRRPRRAHPGGDLRVDADQQPPCSMPQET